MTSVHFTAHNQLLPIATCIAALDKIVLKLTEAPKLGEPFARFSSGELIYPIGRFVGKGGSFLGQAQALRWNTRPDGKARGFFNRGLACYLCDAPGWLKTMPVCK